MPVGKYVPATPDFPNDRKETAMDAKVMLARLRVVTTAAAAVLSTVIAIGLLTAVTGLFQRDGAPFRQIVIAEHVCAHEAMRLFGLIFVQQAIGHPTESDAALRALIENYGADAALQVAQALAYRGQSDAAFEGLERAYKQRDAGLWMTKVAPLLQSLHTDLRWRAFLNKLKVSD